MTSVSLSPSLTPLLLSVCYFARSFVLSVSASVSVCPPPHLRKKGVGLILSVKSCHSDLRRLVPLFVFVFTLRLSALSFSVSLCLCLSPPPYLTVSVYSCGRLFLSVSLFLSLCLSVSVSPSLTVSVSASVSVCLSVCLTLSPPHSPPPPLSLSLPRKCVKLKTWVSSVQFHCSWFQFSISKSLVWNANVLNRSKPCSFCCRSFIFNLAGGRNDFICHSRARAHQRERERGRDGGREGGREGKERERERQRQRDRERQRQRLSSDAKPADIGTQGKASKHKHWH